MNICPIDMKLPKNNDGLTETFRNAAAPDISEFSGEYMVDMLTVFPSFKRFSHRKVFQSENGRISGYNVLFGRTWGHFYLEEDLCRELDSLKVVAINYNSRENSFITRRIRDYVRRIEKNIYLGRFNYLLHRRLYFGGYFSLEKTA